MRKNKIRLSESVLHRIIKESVKRVLRESVDGNITPEYEAWLSEEDQNGKTGNPGEVRSYDLGYVTSSNSELEAEEMGYSDLESYLRFMFDEVSHECPWYWQELGSGYGYHGSEIYSDGGLVCKEIYGQIMWDEDFDGQKYA